MYGRRRGGAGLFAVALAGLLGLPSSSRASTFSIDRGDTLRDVARRNGIPAFVLEAANPQLANGRLLRGDRIAIPRRLIYLVAAGTATASPAWLVARRPASPAPGGASTPLGDTTRLFNAR